VDRLVTLFSGSQQPTVRDAAITYFYHGLSVIPLIGKKAAIDWGNNQLQAAIPETIHNWSKTGRLRNVGIVCGEVSHNLVVMDLDGDNAVEAYELMFPELLNTFTVVTGSGHGKHLYYQVEELPSSFRLSYPNHHGIEMRANGMYVVGAPSLHPVTNRPYRVPAPAPIMKLPNLNEVRSWLYQQYLRKQQPKPQMKTPSQPAVNTPRWAEAALTDECRRVRTATEGSRNDTLNRAAYNLGQIIADNNLSAGRAENALLVAALANGMGEREARATIRSGMTAGQNNPRSHRWSQRASG